MLLTLILILFVVSFNVNWLFTNVPLDETIDIIVNKETIDRILQNAALDHSFAVFQLRKLLCLAVKNGHFLFNNSLYEQVDGVAMGSPLGSLFANIFLAFHKRNWLTNCPLEFKPLVFRPNIDDWFVVFRFRNHVRPFLDYFNSQYPIITLTSELETDSTLPFLDTLIDRSDGFSTSVYRKPTLTSLFTNLDSFVPFSYKRYRVYTLLHHYLKICSSFHHFGAEALKLKKFLLGSGYPDIFLDRCNRVFLDRLFCPPKRF